MPAYFLNEMPDPPAFIHQWDGTRPIDQIYAQWVTPALKPGDAPQSPQPPLLEIYQAHGAQPLQPDGQPYPERIEVPEDQPEAQPALRFAAAALEAAGWIPAEEYENKDFLHCYFQQPPGREWQPTPQLQQELNQA